MLSSLISMIQRWERVNEKKEDHMNTIRQTVKHLHYQVSNQFPKPNELNWLLVQYIELEFEVLYYYNPPEVSAKLEYNVEQHILTALKSMFLEKCDSIRKAPDAASILRLLSGVKKEYFTVNGFISSITKKLLTELGTRREDFECVHLGTYIKDRFNLVDKNFSTSDYGTDSDSDIDTDSHIKANNEAPVEVPLTIGNAVEIVKDKITPKLEQTSEKVLETVVICSDSEDEAPKVSKRKREASQAVATFEIMDDDDGQLNYMVYMAKCEPNKRKKKPKLIPNEEIIICSDSEEEEFGKTSNITENSIDDKKGIVKFEPHVNSSSAAFDKQIELNNNENTEKIVKLETQIEELGVNSQSHQFESTNEIVKCENSESNCSNNDEPELVCDKIEIIEEDVKVELNDSLLDLASNVSENIIEDNLFDILRINSETEEGQSDLNQEPSSNTENIEELVTVCCSSSIEPPTLHISELNDEIEHQYDLPQSQCDKVDLELLTAENHGIPSIVPELNGGFLKSSYFPSDEMLPQIMSDDMYTESPLLYNNLFDSITKSDYTESCLDLYPCTASKETLDNIFTITQGDDVSEFNMIDPHSIFPSTWDNNSPISDGLVLEDTDACRSSDINDRILEEFLSDSLLNESKSNVAALDFFLFNSSKDEPEQCNEFVDVSKSKPCQELLNIFKSEESEDTKKVPTKRKSRKSKRKYSVKKRKKSVVMPLTDFTNSEVFTPLAANAPSHRNRSLKLS